MNKLTNDKDDMLIIYNYKLAKYLGSLLSPHISNKYTTQNFFSFIQEIWNVDAQLSHIF